MTVSMLYRVSFGTSESQAPKAGPTKLARRLALAHAIDRLVENGVLDSYAEAARVLGVTRASIAATVGLVFLSPGIQEAVLDGRLNATRLQLRPIVTAIPWKTQEKLVSPYSNN